MRFNAALCWSHDYSGFESSVEVLGLSRSGVFVALTVESCKTRLDIELTSECDGEEVRDSSWDEICGSISA